MRIIHGDCLEQLGELPDACIDAVICDPPYGLSFMGKKWDCSVPSVSVWRECLRVLKPGAYLLAFASTRTQHRMAVGIEDAGFEIRDMIAWVYGSGFPKSLDVSKAIDRQAGVLKPESKGFTVAGYSHNPDKLLHTAPSRGYVPPAPVTPKAQQWAGWGTALKPALEPITVARKPFAGTVAENVLQWGTGGLNVDGCRIGRAADDISGWSQSGSKASENRAMSGANYAREAKPDAAGRWPANLIHDGSDEVVRLFPQTGASTQRTGKRTGCLGAFAGQESVAMGHDDSGNSAARFFYCAKASKRERGEGNSHPTVKPIALMRYLVRLVTPPGGVVLDPFAGTGTTGIAAHLEGFDFLGIELDEQYAEFARLRLEHHAKPL